MLLLSKVYPEINIIKVMIFIFHWIFSSLLNNIIIQERWPDLLVFMNSLISWRRKGSSIILISIMFLMIFYGRWSTIHSDSLHQLFHGFHHQVHSRLLWVRGRRLFRIFILPSFSLFSPLLFSINRVYLYLYSIIHHIG